MLSKSKLAIGTANFGLNYGLSNANGHLPIFEVHKILEFAYQNNIKCLDTASGYGNAYDVLSQFSKIDQFNVVTKYSTNQILEEHQNFQDLVTEIPGQSRSVLIHDRYSVAEDSKFVKAIEILEASQKVGQIEKFGLSVYSIEELKWAISRFNIGLVQLPLNVFDQRFTDSSIVEELTDAKIEVHTRSCFLQGLLTQKSNQRKGYFDRWNSLFRSWDEYVHRSCKSAVFCALKYALNQKFVNKIVVGLDSLDQLIELKKIEEETYSLDESVLKYFAIEDEDLILPMNWRLE